MKSQDFHRTIGFLLASPHLQLCCRCDPLHASKSIRRLRRIPQRGGGRQRNAIAAADIKSANSAGPGSTQQAVAGPRQPASPGQLEQQTGMANSSVPVAEDSNAWKRLLQQPAADELSVRDLEVQAMVGFEPRAVPPSGPELRPAVQMAPQDFEGLHCSPSGLVVDQILLEAQTCWPSRNRLAVP